MARLTKNCSYGHRDLLSSFPKRPYFLSSGEWTLRNNFSRASWFIRVLSAHSRTRVWGRDLPVTPVILRNKGFPCITSMIIPSPSSHCILGRCRLPGHEIEPARVSPGLLLIHCRLQGGSGLSQDWLALALYHGLEGGTGQEGSESSAMGLSCL